METKREGQTLERPNIKKMLGRMASQIKKPNVKLRKNTKPHKIQDDNQSVNNGVINEEQIVYVGLRSPTDNRG